mmetsp:Transcript_26021/g.39952  ORF Transcript_26021/g.39952 Transcript_26021/m.39952 type:complete len:378 (-) Transcript_26021:94-1227(-)|eukprot:CAMPEP_0195281120 /NCGR_PEP_ID=MMETSP0707-20130614/566_1 /TAXON_ID=33640 /ORGANISM="Asterionellopsis glacialis, Strain CCMP134" /LENGTH=377 /DNA_ID=CAMNT_0040339969 /DNA_START=38 /DNA_END=1171 /DNA_ORIENTATION=+
MSLSLHSAPRFDAQHLQAELNALTEEEIEECNRDVHGTNGNEEDEENNQEEEDDEDEEESEASSSSRQRPPATTGPVIQESPEFLRRAIEDLHQLLLSLEQNPLDQFEEGTHLEIEAYQLALLMCPDYVNSDSFRLMFLRAMQFDIPMTAKRIVVYWSRKVELFGTDRAFHKLTIQDLLDAEGDPRVFERVGIRALPLLDHAGRGLVLSCRAEWPNFSVVGRGLSIIRLLWYTVHQALENEEVQKNGFVGIGVFTDSARTFSSYDSKVMRWAWKDLIKVLPLRIQAHHQLAANDVLNDILGYIMYAMNPRMRARVRMHAIASPLEVGPILENFGIPMDAIPTQFGGNDEFDPQIWLEERQLADSDDNGNAEDGSDDV